MTDLEQYSRINDVIISGLRIRPRSFARAVATNNGSRTEPEEEDVASAEQQVVAFLQAKDIHLDCSHLSFELDSRFVSETSLPRCAISRLICVILHPHTQYLCNRSAIQKIQCWPTFSTAFLVFCNRTRCNIIDISMTAARIGQQGKETGVHTKHPNQITAEAAAAALPWRPETHSSV